MIGSRIFTSPIVQTGCGVHPTSYTMGTGSSLPGVKRPRREADHRPPTSTEAKENVDLYIHFPIRLHGIVFNLLSTGTTLPLPHRKNICSLKRTLNAA
jgi:hypothetical protein